MIILKRFRFSSFFLEGIPVITIDKRSFMNLCTCLGFGLDSVNDYVFAVHDQTSANRLQTLKAFLSEESILAVAKQIGIEISKADEIARRNVLLRELLDALWELVTIT
jgi:hypothetical protein